MTDDRRLALAREIAEFARPPQLADDEITRQDYATAAGIDTQTAAVDLDRQVAAKVLTSRQVYDPRARRIVTAYRKATE